jgi:phosphatidylglycerophosphate synthase
MSGERRPVSSRDVPLFKSIAARFAGWGITPNQISSVSMLFGAASGFAFAIAEGWALWLAALAIQLRLLCNLFDGMVAVEHKKSSPVGELFNEVPDRVSDTLILLGLGLRPGNSLNLALAAALMAMFTAYIRTTGVAAGAKAHFDGPMAKQQRMALLTLLALTAPFLPLDGPLSFAKATELSLWVVIVGGFFTSLRRLAKIAVDLREKK